MIVRVHFIGIVQSGKKKLAVKDFMDIRADSLEDAEEMFKYFVSKGNMIPGSKNGLVWYPGGGRFGEVRYMKVEER